MIISVSVYSALLFFGIGRSCGGFILNVSLFCFLLLLKTTGSVPQFFCLALEIDFNPASPDPCANQASGVVINQY